MIPGEDAELAEMSPEDAARWYAARTLADLGELTALWLESVPQVHSCGSVHTAPVSPHSGHPAQGCGYAVSQPGRRKQAKNALRRRSTQPRSRCESTRHRRPGRTGCWQARHGTSPRDRARAVRSEDDAISQIGLGLPPTEAMPDQGFLMADAFPDLRLPPGGDSNGLDVRGRARW
jgi:hypothetical protein